jgi:pyruvate dehydrogenase E1 component alpha subunit
MDVLAMRAAAEEALAHCRSGAGPFLLEARTYRYRGHSMADPDRYGTRDEIARVRERHDPIDTLRGVILARKAAEHDTLREIDRTVRARVNDAARFAQDSPEPHPATLMTDILAETGRGRAP